MWVRKTAANSIFVLSQRSHLHYIPFICSRTQFENLRQAHIMNKFGLITGAVARQQLSKDLDYCTNRANAKTNTGRASRSLHLDCSPSETLVRRLKSTRPLATDAVRSLHCGRRRREGGNHCEAGSKIKNKENDSCFCTTGPKVKLNTNSSENTQK